MNEPTPDDDLQALFDRQRAADRERASNFHATRSRALASTATASRHGLPLAGRWLWPAGAALAAAIVGLLVAHQQTVPPAPSPAALARQLDEIDAALQRSAAAQQELTAWQSPTDFLIYPTLNDHHP
jgi:hypothetical protein